jgi:hypothetical protein
VAADDAASRVGHTGVQVRAVGSDGAGQRQHLDVDIQLERRLGAGQADARRAQAADAGEHERGRGPLRGDGAFERGAQVVAGNEPDRPRPDDVGLGCVRRHPTIMPRPRASRRLTGLSAGR